jgi:hypothetical protein
MPAEISSEAEKVPETKSWAHRGYLVETVRRVPSKPIEHNGLSGTFASPLQISSEFCIDPRQRVRKS